jgi:hypothetical protein
MVRFHHTVRAANTDGTPVRDGKDPKHTKILFVVIKKNSVHSVPLW